MLVMAKQQKAVVDRQAKDQKKLLIAVGVITAIKLMLIPNIQQSLVGFHPGAWLGSDGETYVAASEALTQDGIFSKNSSLIYYAPGYSLFLSILQILTGKLLFPFVSLIQTLLYSYSIFFLGQQMLKTKLKKIAFPFVIISLLNPTLSLSSLVIGYENLIASFSVLALGLLIRDLKSEKATFAYSPFLIAAILLGFTVWLSPRMILPGFTLLLIWVFCKNGFKKNLFASLMVIAIFLSFQSSVVLRNQIATGNLVSQSSLGNLAIMGAGPNATGSYTDNGTGIICATEGLNASQSSNKKLSCAIQWYAKNPGQGLLLLWKKSYYLWSPWFGPLYGGTMARNPYLIFHPVKSNITTQSQLDLVMGIPGKIISWVWILGSWLLLVIGFRALFKSGGLQRVIGNVTLMLIISNWLTVLVVQGDNRYRIPFMPFSLLLQVCGYMTLRKIKYLN